MQDAVFRLLFQKPTYFVSRHFFRFINLSLPGRRTRWGGRGVSYILLPWWQAQKSDEFL